MADVSCACGAVLKAADSDAGKERTCSSCGASFKIVWASGPGGRVLRRVSAVRVPPGCFEVHCACGQPLVARREHSGKRVTCPVCGGTMTVEAYRDPQTLHTRIRRRDPGATTAVTATRRSAAPPGGQDILCPCGESLRVSREHLDKQAMCPACGALMMLDREKNHETQMTEVRPRIIGKGTPPAPPPPPPEPPAPPHEPWSLQDFE